MKKGNLVALRQSLITRSITGLILGFFLCILGYLVRNYIGENYGQMFSWNNIFCNIFSALGVLFLGVSSIILIFNLIFSPKNEHSEEH